MSFVVEINLCLEWQLQWNVLGLEKDWRVILELVSYLPMTLMFQDPDYDNSGLEEVNWALAALPLVYL